MINITIVIYDVEEQVSFDRGKTAFPAPLSLAQVK